MRADLWDDRCLSNMQAFVLYYTIRSLADGFSSGKILFNYYVFEVVRLPKTFCILGPWKMHVGDSDLDVVGDTCSCFFMSPPTTHALLRNGKYVHEEKKTHRGRGFCVCKFFRWIFSIILVLNKNFYVWYSRSWYPYRMRGWGCCENYVL